MSILGGSAPSSNGSHKKARAGCVRSTRSSLFHFVVSRAFCCALSSSSSTALGSPVFRRSFLLQATPCLFHCPSLFDSFGTYFAKSSKSRCCTWSHHFIHRFPAHAQLSLHPQGARKKSRTVPKACVVVPSFKTSSLASPLLLSWLLFLHQLMFACNASRWSLHGFRWTFDFCSCSTD